MPRSVRLKGKRLVRPFIVKFLGSQTIFVNINERGWHFFFFPFYCHHKKVMKILFTLYIARKNEKGAFFYFMDMAIKIGNEVLPEGTRVGIIIKKL